MRVNSVRIKERLRDDIPAHDRTATLVCYGPSLKHTWPLIGGRDVFTVSAAHRFLIDRGVYPSVHIDCDPRAHKAVQMGEPSSSVDYWMASCVHPSYLDKLEGHKVTLWHLHNGPETEVAFFSDPIFKADEWLCVGGGSVGLRSVSLLYTQGYRNFEIHGMDCSYEGPDEFAGEHLGKARKRTRVKCGERWFESNLSLIDYARQFLDDLRLWPDASFRMHGDGLLQHMCKTGEAA